MELNTYFLKITLVCNPMDCSPPGSFCPWDFPGKNTEVGCHFLLQGILPTQGWNPCLLHWQADSLPLSHLGGPLKITPNYKESQLIHTAQQQENKEPNLKMNK